MADGITPTPAPLSPPDPEAVPVLLLRLARALHTYGAPAYRLEEALGRISRRLGIEGQFFSTPTSLFAGFGPPGMQRMALERVDPGEVNLEKLSALDEVLDGVARGEVSPARALAEVERITSAPPRYGPLLSILAYGAVSAAAACFFGGSGIDVIGSSALGSLIGALAVLSARLGAANRLLELTCATLAAFLAHAGFAWRPDLSVLLVIVSALIGLLPGLSLTVSINELATRHLVAGSSRFAGTMLVFVTLAFGTALGTQVGIRVFGTLGESALMRGAALPAWLQLPALLIYALGATVLLRARPRDLGWALLAGALAFGGAKAGVRILGGEAGALVGALLLGVGSNLFGRLRQRPVAVTQVPGLLLLVPGSLGFRSLSALIERETLPGLEAAFRVLLVAVALVTGLLVANAVLPPRRNL